MSSKKSIFKLSRREEREYRELEASRRRARLASENRASAASVRWGAIRARLDGRLVNFAVIEATKISPLARKNMAVFERDNFTCRDCFKEFDHPDPYYGETIPGLTRGHIIPDAQGGPGTVENLIAQCEPCNQALGNNVWNPNILTIPEWMEGADE